jgi:hypothetical protein
MPLVWTTFQNRCANRDSFSDLDCLSLDLWLRMYAILQLIVRQWSFDTSTIWTSLIFLKNEVWTSARWNVLRHFLFLLGFAMDRGPGWGSLLTFPAPYQRLTLT